MPEKHDPCACPGALRRAPLRVVLPFFTLAWLLSGCNTLPQMAPAEALAKDDLVHVSAPVNPRVFARVRDEGRQKAFERHVHLLGLQGERIIAGNEIDLLIDGPSTFDAMLKAIEQAEERIFLQTYIFEDEDIGRRIAEALLRKSAEGVAVHVIYDAVGSLLTPTAFFQELRAGGVIVCQFNPVSPWRRLTGILDLNHRDHRKMLLVDNRVAFTGGINVSSVYASGSLGFAGNYPDEENAGWRDTHISVKGPAVQKFDRLFGQTWSRQSCVGSPPHASRAPRIKGERLVTVIGSVADQDSSRFYRALLTALNGATDTIHITMAYFVPDPQTVQALAAAARRGVEVELVLPGFSDSRLALHAGRSHYDTLLEAGVRVFEFHESLLHAKTVVVDGVWSTVGSSNLDWRSFLHNDELNAIVLGHEFGAAMEAQFRDDRARAEEVTLEQWRSRGVLQRSLEGVGRLFEYWL